MCRNIKTPFFSVVLVIVVQCFGAGPAQSQQSISSADVVKALTPSKTSATRSLVATSKQGAALSADEKAFLKNIPTRGLKFDTVKRVEKILSEKSLPTLDIEIRFKFASSEIQQGSLKDINALGNALTHPSLVDSRVLLNGHTDAKGSVGYNLKLSKQRANVVRDFLISNFAIRDRRLVAIGLGERRLKDSATPESDANRRVEVVNLGN